MEELLELQKVKEKEQIEQTRSLKEANTEIRKHKNNQDHMSQKVVRTFTIMILLGMIWCRRNHYIRI